MYDLSNVCRLYFDKISVHYFLLSYGYLLTSNNSRSGFVAG